MTFVGIVFLNPHLNGASMHKVEKCGKDGNRFFYEVKTNKTVGEYRSRAKTAEQVTSILQKFGHKVQSVKPVMA